MLPQAKNPPPLVSLIVVTYNSALLLPDFVAALARPTYAPSEVLRVDHAAQDAPPQPVRGVHPSSARWLPQH